MWGNLKLTGCGKNFAPPFTATARANIRKKSLPDLIYIIFRRLHAQEQGSQGQRLSFFLNMNYPSPKFNLFFYFLLPAHIHIQWSMKADLIIRHVSKFQEEINTRMYHYVLNRDTFINYVNISDFVSVAVKSRSFIIARFDARNLFLCTILSIQHVFLILKYLSSKSISSNASL